MATQIPPRTPPRRKAGPGSDAPVAPAGSLW